MVKSELIQKLCNIYPNIFRKDLEKIVDIIISEMIGAFCKNQAVEIRGFGRFKTVTKKARIGRNPKNSQSINIPSKKAVKWKMSKILYKKLNKDFNENIMFATN